METLAPYLHAIETELRRLVSSDGPLVVTGAVAWRAVLAYAARPIGSVDDRYPDSDIVRFTVRTVAVSGDKIVGFERQIGLQEPGWGYIGRLRAFVEFRVVPGPLWTHAPDAFTVDGIETMASLEPGGLKRFRHEVECSPAFRAFSDSEITDVCVSGSES